MRQVQGYQSRAGLPFVRADCPFTCRVSPSPLSMQWEVSLENKYIVYVALDSDLVEAAAEQPIPPIANQALWHPML